MNIDVKNLTKSYNDKTVIKDLNLSFRGGETTVILGRSGVGKTTLLNCIAKTVSYSGEIIGVSDGVSYVFQEDRLIESMTVYDNLRFALSSQIAKEKREDEILDALVSLDMKDKIFDFPSNLSGGEKKRVALCRAFLSPREVMLLDEPTNSLDFGLKYKTFELFYDLQRKYLKTAIYITHDIDEALYVGDRIVVLSSDGISYDKRLIKSKKTRNILSEENIKVRQDLMQILAIE